MKKIFTKLSTMIFTAALTFFLICGKDIAVSAEGGNPYGGGWSNCTWSTWQLVYESTGIELPRWGNGGEWAYSAAMQGWYVSAVPAANTIAVWTNHVAYVTDVSEDGSSVFIREGGYMGGYNEGWYSAYDPRSWQSLIGYIYIGGAVPESYYRPSDLSSPISHEEAKKNAEQAKMIASEEQKVVKIDDAISSDTLKEEEKSAKQEMSVEDKSTTVIIPIK